MREGHQVVAVNMALGLASVGLVSASDAAVLAAGALITAAGPFSPDCDNRRPLNRFVRHRGTLHGWGWPVLVALALVMAGAPLVAYGPVLGWWSHLPADAAFGRGGRSIPRGIPAAPFGGKRRIGLGLKVTGPIDGHSVLEISATWLLGALVAVQCWWLVVSV